MPHHASCRRARRWIEAKLSEGDETNDGLIFAITITVCVLPWPSIVERWPGEALVGEA
jgi:hypothetical protein